ncbi:MAG: hypothetical protein WC326_01420 [Candidatus Delongbacteria bacterium]
MRLSTTLAGVLLGVAALFQGGCVDNPQLRQALRELAREAHAQAGGGAEQDDKAEDSQLQIQLAGEAAEAAGLDSLLRLAAQDVGIDPDEGSVQRAIWRVRVIKLNLGAARRSLDNTRQEIFGLAATGEELKALKELDGRLAATPDSSAGDLILERRRLQDEAIERAKADGTLQKKKLSGDQAKRVGLLLYNLGVGVVCDNLAIRHSTSISRDFQRVKQDLFDNGGWNGALAWVSLAAYHQEFLAIPADLKEILQEAPAQVQALGAMIGTVRVLKENNAIEEREVQPGSSFESLEDF